jgi:hypothetical protein
VLGLSSADARGRFAVTELVSGFLLDNRSVQRPSLDMPRQLRIGFEGAIDHVMARGNARQKNVRDDADRRRLIVGLESTVVRRGWVSACYVIRCEYELRPGFRPLAVTPFPFPRRD